MEYYAAIDVSLDLSSVCIVDGTGKIPSPGRHERGQYLPIAVKPSSRRDSAP